MTTHTLKNFLTVITTAKSRHRLLEQHFIVMRTLLRYQFDARLTAAALLAKGNMLELIIVEDPKLSSLMVVPPSDYM